MFKKTKIAAVSTAILGLSSMAAQAVSVNDPGSEGQVLIFPYYNVNNEFITSYNITNTTGDYKAVKVRFRESDQSNDVLDFNVYMSPYDMWTMSIIGNGSGGVKLLTKDNTCTFPKIPTQGVEFLNAYNSVDDADLREGYLEVIEMGVVNEESVVDDGTNDGQKIASEGLLHVDGKPIDCTVVERAWKEGVFVQGGAESNTGMIDVVLADSDGYPNDALGELGNTTGWYGTSPSDWSRQEGALSAPTGGLIGSSILLDTVNIAGFVAEPTSIVNYSTIPQHYLSSDKSFYLLPSLASGDVDDVVFLDDNFADAITETWPTVVRDWGLDDKNLLPNVSVPSGINPMPISRAMAVTYVANQYFLEGTIATDWVIGTPMRKHAIFNDYQYIPDPCVDPISCAIATYTPGTDIPVNGDLGDLFAPYGFWKFLDIDDVEAGFVYYDREEAKATVDPGDFSPPLQSKSAVIPFEREVNILALSNGTTPSSVLGSENARGLIVETGFENGWGFMDFSDYDLADNRYQNWLAGSYPSEALGVPITGFMAARGPLGGQNVGETFPHAYKTVHGIN